MDVWESTVNLTARLPARGLTAHRGAVKPSLREAEREQTQDMALALILLIVAVVLILLGVFVEAAKFLLWIGLVILLIAIIAWLMRVVKRNA